MNIFQRWWWLYRLQGSHYQHLFHTYTGGECVSLDCDTLNLPHANNKILTIAATKIINKQVSTCQPFHVNLLTPHSARQNTSDSQHHQESTENDRERQAIEQLIAFIGNRPLVGYHIRHDKMILDFACRRHLGFPLPNKLLEITHIYHQKMEHLLPDIYSDLSLDAICQHLELPIQVRHDALQNTITAALIYTKLTHSE